MNASLDLIRVLCAEHALSLQMQEFLHCQMNIVNCTDRYMAARLAVEREDETDGINEYSSVDLSQSDLLMMSGGERRERRRERANKMESRYTFGKQP